MHVQIAAMARTVVACGFVDNNGRLCKSMKFDILPMVHPWGVATGEGLPMTTRAGTAFIGATWCAITKCAVFRTNRSYKATVLPRRTRQGAVIGDTRASGCLWRKEVVGGRISRQQPAASPPYRLGSAKHTAEESQIP